MDHPHRCSRVTKHTRTGVRSTAARSWHLALLLAAAMGVASPESSAQTVDISGIVRDANSLRAIGSANVQLKNSSVGVATGGDGRFPCASPLRHRTR